jgi:hypothetical protein
MIRARPRFERLPSSFSGCRWRAFRGHAQSSAKDEASLAARAEYLARAADCMPCHTVDRSKPYAAGFHTPFGTIFSVNIPADHQTGIGQWISGRR